MLPARGNGLLHLAGRSLERAIERVKLAESLGYESVYVTHIAGRESLTVLTAYALATSRIRVGHRRGADLHAHARDDGADGGHDRRALRRAPDARPRRLPPPRRRGLARADDRPPGRRDARIRDDRARDPARRGSSGGREVADRLPPLRPRPAPASCRSTSPRSPPRCCASPARSADGVLLWLCCPDYIRDVVIPEVTRGPRTGRKTLEGFDVVPAVPTALVEDPAEPYAAMRRDLLPYFGLPFYRAMLERSGFGEEIAAFDAAAGDFEQMQAAISERFLDAAHRGRRRVGRARGPRAATARRARPPRASGPIPEQRFRGHAAGWDRVAARRGWVGSHSGSRGSQSESRSGERALSAGCRNIADSERRRRLEASMMSAGEQSLGDRLAGKDPRPDRAIGNGTGDLAGGVGRTCRRGSAQRNRHHDHLRHERVDGRRARRSQRRNQDSRRQHPGQPPQRRVRCRKCRRHPWVRRRATWNLP